MSVSRHIGRILAWTIGLFLSVAILLLILINMSFVQDMITGYAESYLSKKTQTPITVEKISINFLGHLLIREVLVPDRQQDTLFYLGKLEVGFQLREILRKKIRIKSMEIDDVLVDIHPARDTIMNYQFLIDAFGGSSDPAPAPEEEENGSGDSWDVILPNAHLALNRVRLNFLAPDSAMVVRSRIGAFEASTSRADVLAGLFDLDRLSLEDSDIFLKMANDSTEAPPDTTPATRRYRFNAGELAITNVNYRMELEDLLIDSQVGTAVATGNRLQMLGDTMRIAIDRFDLAGSRYAMDTPSAPPSPGLDYSHLDFDDVQIRISNFNYDDLDMTGEVRQLAGRDHSGFELYDFQTRIHYAIDSIELWALHAATPQTRINAEHGKVTFPFLEDSTRFEEMLIDLQLDSTILHPVDLAYFVPDLDEQDFFRQHREQPLQFSTRVYGTLADLAISRFELRGWEARANLSGRLKHIADMDKLEADLRIAAIESTGSGIRRWLSSETLPGYIDLPGAVLLRGQIQGPLQQLDLQLEATTSRTALPVAARLQLNGQVINLMDTERFAYDIAIDTFWTSRQEMSAYLPDSFPPYIELPEAIALTGKLKGNMDTVFADLHLETFRDSIISEIRIAGTVDSFTNTEELAYDLNLSELIVQPEEMAAYLPDSTLPNYIRLPLITHGEGAFRGDLANIDARCEIFTPDGTLGVEAKLKDSAYVANVSLEDLHLQGFFTDSVAYDSVVGWPAPLIALQVSADGKGLDLERDLRANTSVRLRMIGDTINWKDGLVIKGDVDRQSFRGTLRVKEREVDIDLSILADFNPGMDTAALKGQFNNIDLHGLKLSERPFQLKAGLNMKSRGRSLDSLRLNFIASDFFIGYNGVSESTKQLSVSFRRSIAENILAFFVRSDFFLAAGLDQAANAQVFENGLDELLKMLEAEKSQLQLNPDSTQNLLVLLAVNRPEIFTSGIIPGLTELEPIEMQGILDMQDSSFAVYAKIPHVKYQSFELDSAEIKGVNWDELFFTQLTIQEAHLFDRIDVRELGFSGLKRPGSDTLLFFLQQQDSLLTPNPDQTTRFQVVTFVTPKAGNYHVHFTEKQTLNYDTLWRIDPRNEIVYGNGKLDVRNLKLSRDDRSLSINEVSDDKIQVDFNNFDLAFFADIIKWKSDYLTGIADGQIVVQDVLDSMRLQTDLNVTDFGVLATPLGDLSLKAGNASGGDWNADVALRGEGNEVEFTGSYLPAEPAAEIKGQLRAAPLNLASLLPLATGYVSELGGAINTDLTISGNVDKPVLAGDLDFQDVAVRPVATNSRLEIPGGKIRFSENVISSPQAIVIRDSLGREATLNLALLLDKYPDVRYATQLEAENFLLLNTPPQDTALYYGTLYSDIKVNVAGSTREVVNVNCFITPREGSSLVYVFDTGETLDELENGEGLFMFVDFETMDSTETLTFTDSVRNSGGVDFNLSSTLNKDLDLTIIMDRELGDRLEGKAEGDLVLHYPPRGDMDLTGQLDVSGSKYFFTYEKVIRKEFELQDGSNITFVGPVDNPTLNLKAGYSARTTPDLLVSNYGGAGSESDQSSLKRRQEFLVSVRAEGTLEEAEISADIEYAKTPGNSSAHLVEPALAKLRSDPSEMNTQAFSLVLFNSFRLSGGSGSGKPVINLKQEVGNILSSQLNKLADQFVNFVELDFGIETLSDGNNNLNFEGTDFRLGVKKRLFEDRLEVRVDGKVRAGGQEQNMQSFLENVSLEYALNKKRSLRVRAFNQYQNDDLVGGNVLKIGGALLISKDFNRLFFKKHFKQPILPPADSSKTPTPIGTDSPNQNR